MPLPPPLRRIPAGFALLLALLLPPVAFAAEPAVTPVTLTPLEQGAALSGELGPLGARLRYEDLAEGDDLGGAFGLDLGRLRLKASLDGPLAEVFAAPGELALAGAQQVADLFARSSGLGLRSLLGDLALAVAAGRDAEARTLIAGELHLRRGPLDLSLLAGSRAEQRRLIGARTHLAATGSLGLEFAGRLEEAAEADEPARTAAGFALVRRNALTRGDRLRAELARTPAGRERLELRYAAPLALGRVSLDSSGTPETDEFTANAAWRFEF